MKVEVLVKDPKETFSEHYGACGTRSSIIQAYSETIMLHHFSLFCHHSCCQVTIHEVLVLHA